MLADEADHVIGVDTHRDTHTAAAVETQTGVVGESKTTSADSLGHKRMLAFAEEHAPASRVWAIESTGSYGSGLTTYLLERGERVVEVDRPKRPARRSGAKSDHLDAIRAAKEALEREHPTQPRRRSEREAVRVLQRTREGAVRARSRAICHLKALVVTAPEGLRSQLRRLDDAELVPRCARLRTGAQQSTEHRMTVKELRPRPVGYWRSRPRRRTWNPSSSCSSAGSARPCSPSPASASSRRRSFSTPGRTLGGFVAKRRSRCSAGRRRSRRPRGRRCATGSTAAAIASSTARCTRSSSRACSTTPKPRPTPPGARPRAEPPRRLSAA